MPQVKVELQGLKRAIDNIKAYQFKKKKQVKDHILITGLNIETAAKKNVPVDNGILRGSIRTLWKKSDGMGMEVGTTIIYGAYIEYGEPTGTGPNGGPKPYLNPAAEYERPKYIKELKKILRSTK